MVKKQYYLIIGAKIYLAKAGHPSRLHLSFLVIYITYRVFN